MKRLKTWIGDLWWYTAIFFIVQRFGDAINAFVGLWLVPKYVPQDELGALLPLAQVGNVLALPLSILAIVFSKYVNIFAFRGETGKLKSLLRDAFFLAAVFFLAVMVYARLVMPFVFERMRVADGRLGMLVVASGILGAVAVFFTNALQALKKFKLVSMVGFFGAPLRLATLLVALPVRALSGYFVGQIVPTLYGIGAALVGLRSVLFNRSVQAEGYLRQEGRGMARFAAPILLGSLAGIPQGFVEAFVIRHRLPDLESAGYYMISRFSEMGAYVGVSMMFVLFPLASEQHERGDASQKLVVQSMIGTLLFGCVLAAGFRLWGGWMLSCVPTWRPYAVFSPHMALLALVFAMRASASCFASFEMAHHRFSFYWYSGAVSILESLLLYGFTGLSFLSRWVAAPWVYTIPRAFSRLGVILSVMFCSSVVVLAIMFLATLKRRGGMLRGRV